MIHDGDLAISIIASWRRSAWVQTSFRDCIGWTDAVAHMVAGSIPLPPLTAIAADPVLRELVGIVRSLRDKPTHEVIQLRRTKV